VRKFWKIIIITATSALIPIFVTVPTVAKPQLNGMTNAQQETLKSLGIKVVVPSYAPGFQVAKVMAQCPLKRSRTGDCHFGPRYGIIYHSPKNACFAIEGASGGRGDVDGEYKVPVTSKLFGATMLWFSTTFPPNGSSPDYRTPSLAQLQTLQFYLITSWMSASPSSGPTYLLRSGAKVFSNSRDSDSYTSGCKIGITPQEAVQIIKSLEWLP
jgi:hypothetical protein